MKFSTAQSLESSTALIAPPQLAVITGGSAIASVIPDPENAPLTQTAVSGMPAGAIPNCVATYSTDRALISDGSNSRIFVVQLSTGSVMDTIQTAPHYDGYGSLAISSDQSIALASSGTTSSAGTTLNVIRAPFGTSSVISQITLPGIIFVAQTQGIIFDNSGRGYIHHSNGISVIDPPYNALAFTIPIAPANTNGISIGVTPDGNKLLATRTDNSLRIFTAPLSSSSVPQLRAIPSAQGLWGIKVSDDGTRAIVVSRNVPHAAVISAPFGSSSTVTQLAMPTGNGGGGFEDVDISPDGLLAIITGGGAVTNPGSTQAVLIKMPISTTPVSSRLPILGGSHQGRAGGSVRFIRPTFTSVGVSGLVTTPDGRALRNAVVSITNSLGVRRTILTSTFGAYTFDDVASGATYTLSVSSRRYRFAARQVTVSGNLTDVNFVGLE